MSPASVTDTVPPKIRPGDTIAVCAPSGPVPRERLERGVAILRQRYRVIIDSTIYRKSGYLAGSDEQRAAEFNNYLANSEIRAILVARGGYGAMRILEHLNADALKRDPKLIIGFSDATALLCWARAQGVRSIHGPVGCQLAELPSDDLAWLFQLMENSQSPGTLPCPVSPCGHDSNAQFQGHLVGGNLCVLSHLVGTKYLPDFSGAIALLEDVNERPYAIDRYLTHLALAGTWQSATGALLGEFTCSDVLPPKTEGAPQAEGSAQAEDSPNTQMVVDERFRSFGLPAAMTKGFGHGQRNLALPFGGHCVVDRKRQTVALIDPAVQ